VLRSSNNKFDQFVKGTFENGSVEPSPFLWDRIEKQLPPVTTWYSKYKYLLLLLLLSFSSASSIFIYKQFFLKKSVSTIALNKRYFKDERNVMDKKSTVSVTVNTVKKEKLPSNLPDKKSPVNSQNNISVASFYTNTTAFSNPSVPNITQLFMAQREEHLKKMMVKNENVKAYQKILEENPGLVAKNITSENQISNEVSSGTLSSRSDLSAQNTQNTITETNYADPASGISAASSTNTFLNEDDVTQPIVDPIRRNESSALTASASPVKAQLSPLSGKDILRSVLPQNKLEKLDVKPSSSTNQLSRAKKKMQRNQKQFGGYDINKGFHIGAFFGVNNFWLTKKQYSSDENTVSISPKMRLSKSYGINIGFDYTDRWGIELEWQMSEQGQKYMVEQADGMHSKDVSLRYTKFPLMIKYKQIFLNNYRSKPFSLSLLLGPHMSFLVKQKVTLDGIAVNEPPQYNKVEMGLMGGFDFDVFLTRFMNMTVGARSGFGSSLRKGQPMSIQLGITTQFNFRFPKKI
jgi:hypothetical protein